MSGTGPIGLGIVGLGRAGWGMHVPELKGKEAMFRIVGGFDVLPERMERLASATGSRKYGSLDELIADPDVEIIDVATRSCDHFAHAAAALEAGKTVFLEKPMCTTFDEAKRLKAAAAKSKGALHVRHNRRFENGFLHVREIIASGVLGDVFEVRLSRLGYSRRDDWQTLIEFGGGQLLNWGPHIIDHALRFLESPAREIRGELKRIAAVGDAEDHLKVILTGENGRVVEVEISGGAAVGAPEYVVLGTKGGLTATGDTITLRHLDPEQVLPERRADPGTPGETFGTREQLRWIEKTIPVAPSKTSNIWEELYKAVREGSPFPITTDEAVDVMRVISEVKRGTEFEPRRKGPGGAKRERAGRAAKKKRPKARGRR